MKNLRGNDIYIFLFRFVVNLDGVTCELNQGILADMTPDIERLIQPHIHFCCVKLMALKVPQQGEILLDGHFVGNGVLEIALNQAIEHKLSVQEKLALQFDAKQIADYLTELMNRRVRS